MKKKILMFLFCTITAAVSLVAVNVAKAEAAVYFIYGDYEYQVKSGNAIITNFDKAASGAIEIPSTLNGYPVTSIETNAFSSCTSLTSVTIPNGVINIGDMAFSYCDSLKSITIPKSMAAIGKSAFFGCNSLTNINVSINNQHYCSFNGVLFNKNMQELLQYPASKSGSFYAIPDSVTSVGRSAFYNCDNLMSVTIPNSVTSIGDGAFKSCDNLTSVNISNMADWCNIKFEDSDSNPLDCAQKLYLNDEEVINLVIPYEVTAIGDYAFSNCKNLQSITIPDSLRGIGERAFFDCNNLKNVNICDISAWCSMKFNDIYSNPLNYAQKLYLNGEEVMNLVIPEGVTVIGDYTFYNCQDLTSIMISDGVTTIGEGAFYNCSGLTSVTIPDSVTTIGDYAFYNCSSLKTVYMRSSATWEYQFSDSVEIILYDFIITYVLDGEEFFKEYILYSQPVVFPKPPENYKYIFTVDGKEWTGERVTKNVTVTVTKISNVIEPMIVPLDGGAFKVDDVYAYNFKLEASKAVSGKVVIAFYDENKFVDMILKDIDAQTQCYIEGEAKLKADATKYKAFIWDDLSKPEPLADFVEGNVE